MIEHFLGIFRCDQEVIDGHQSMNLSLMEKNLQIDWAFLQLIENFLGIFRFDQEVIGQKSIPHFLCVSIVIQVVQTHASRLQ